MEKPKKLELAAILTAFSVSAATASYAASPQEGVTTGSNTENSGLFGVKEHRSPTRLGSDNACGEGMCGTSDKDTKEGQKGTKDSQKGKKDSHKGKDGSCKGKDGSCKGKDGSCKSKDKN